MLRGNSASGALAIRKWDFTTSLWRKSSSSRTAQGPLTEKAAGEKLRAFRGVQGPTQGCIPQHLHQVMTWKQLCLSQGSWKTVSEGYLLYKCGKSGSDWNSTLKCLLPALCLTKTHRQAHITSTQHPAGMISAEAKMPIKYPLPGGSDGKESACHAGDPGSIPESGRSPGEGSGQPTPALLPGESQGERSLVGHSPGGKDWHDWATNTNIIKEIKWHWQTNLTH